MGEYIPYTKLEEIVSYDKEMGNKIVLTGGCFDILHTGHLNFLRKSKELGDVLVVNVVNDPRVRMYKGEKRPINDSRRRATIVSSLEMVDYVTIHPSVDKGPTIELAILIKPDVIAQETGKLGPEDRERIRELLGYDVELRNIRRSSATSTSEIIEKIVENRED